MHASGGMRVVEDVVREIMEDTHFKGQQHYRFQERLDDDGCQRLFRLTIFRGEASAGVSFQIGQLRYV